MSLQACFVMNSLFRGFINYHLLINPLKSEFITKQACRDENVVSLFIFPYNNIYIYIYINIYIYILVNSTIIELFQLIEGSSANLEQLKLAWGIETWWLCINFLVGVKIARVKSVVTVSGFVTILC